MTRSRPQQKTLTTPEIVVRAMPDAMPSITITTDAVDAMQDRIKQDGLTFRDPLPVLFGHNYQQIPVGQSRRAWVTRTPHRTSAAWRWLEGDDQAARVKNAFDQHFLAASVGMTVEDAERNELGGYDILRATVIEFSLTAVPANPDCVRLLKDLAMWDAGRDAVVLYLDDTAGADEIVLELVDDETADDYLILDVGGRPRTLTRAEIEEIIRWRVAWIAPDVRAKVQAALHRRGRRA